MSPVVPTYTLTIPAVPPSLNKWQRMIWQVQLPIKHQWYEDMGKLVKVERIPRLELVDLDITIYWPTNRRRDWDNGVVAFKLIQDGLVLAGVLPDDNPCHILRPRFPDIQVDRKHPRTVAHITAIGP